MCSFLETHGCLQMYFRRAEFCWLDFAVFAWACILIHHQSLLYVYFKRKGYNSVRGFGHVRIVRPQIFRVESWSGQKK